MKKAFNILVLGLLLIPTISFSQIEVETYKFSRVLSLANNFYVDTINKEKLVEYAIIGMLKELDPHSVYISADEVERTNESLKGSFDGVGVQFNILDDTLIVVSPIVGGPSEKIGIRAGDRIVEIDSINIAGIGLKNSDVFKKLRGKKGTKVQVKIKRGNNEDLLEFIITRDKIPIYSVDASYVVKDDIGYIKLSRFAGTTMAEINKAVTKLKARGVKNIILDLRGNGGGYLRTAIDLADEFLTQGQLIVYTEGIHNPKEEHFATDNGDFSQGRLVVLVDEGSASASEIVSGAIQDWDRGLIIGRRTFGKGLVQRQFVLPDNSMMRLTVAKYYTPSTRCIQKSYAHGAKEYSEDIINRYNNGELTNADSIHFPDSLRYETKTLKRTVYGGGGIMPDIFIPLDTTKVSDLYAKLFRKGVIYQFTIDYMDKHRSELETKYTDFEVFKDKFVMTDEMYNGLLERAEKEKIEFIDEDKAKSFKEIELIFKALIARDLWNMSEYFQIVNPTDDTFNKAVEVISNQKEYKNNFKKK